MKANEKKNDFESEEQIESEPSRDQNGGDDIQEPSADQIPRKNRFLACLHNAWARITCRRRRTSSDLPGLQKCWTWITTLNQRGKYYINEESASDIIWSSTIEMENSTMDSDGEILCIGEATWNGTYSTSEESSNEIPCPSDISIEGEIISIGTYPTSDKSFSAIPWPSKICVQTDNTPSNDEEEHPMVDSYEEMMEEDASKSEISFEASGSSEETSSETVPLTLESFTFHHKLGEGSYGQVYLATDIIRKEHVAIKVTKKRHFTEHGQSLVERHVLQISHKSPYLIQGLAAFQTSNFLYYVLELATGGDLYHFIQKYNPLDTATIRFVTAELVCGTEFLHNQGILHRDLKPDNILLTREGHIKITDFGLAVTGVSDTIKDRFRGTPGYGAPEMLEYRAYGRGVDFFAIGVILYKMCTGKHPFPATDERGVRYLVLSREPRCPPHLTPETVSIIKGLLCKDQYERLEVNDIKRHCFFSEIKWEDVEAGRMAPPTSLMAASAELDVQETLDYYEWPIMPRCDHQDMFNDFNFVCPEWSKQYCPIIIDYEDTS